MINLYHKYSNNVGDKYCSPVRYFPLDCANDDLARYGAHLDEDILFGGGMLLKKIISWNVLDKIKGLKIGWGIGNARFRNGNRSFNYSGIKILKKFDLLGVRDFGIGLNYVPCPSCMSPLFDNDYEKTSPVVFYENSQAKPLIGPSVQGNENKTMDEVIRFLGSADLVVTSSYHGVYWSMLLCRKVVAIPFNSKFYTMRHEIPKATLKDWRAVRSKAKIHPDFLQECRALNRRFYERVVDYCSNSQR